MNITILASAHMQVLWQVCDAEAKSLERAASAARAEAWKNWAAITAMANGARLAHRFSLAATPSFPTHPAQTGETSIPQEQADSAAAQWHELWAAYRHRPPIDLKDALMTQPNVVPSVEIVKSIGTDNMHGRPIASLCDVSFETISRIMVLSINAGMCPSTLATALMVQLPKAARSENKGGFHARCSLVHALDAAPHHRSLGTRFRSTILVLASAAEHASNVHCA